MTSNVKIWLRRMKSNSAIAAAVTFKRYTLAQVATSYHL